MIDFLGCHEYCKTCTQNSFFDCSTCEEHTFQIDPSLNLIDYENACVENCEELGSFFLDSDLYCKRKTLIHLKQFRM